MNRKEVIIVVAILSIAVVVVIGVAVGILLLTSNSDKAEVEIQAELPASGPTTNTPDSLPLSDSTQELMRAIEGQVSALRELEPNNEVPKAFQTETQLRERLEDDFAEDYSLEEARDDVLSLAAFDFVGQELDLYNLFLDLLTEQIAGYYDTEAKEFFVISSATELGTSDQLTFAHEYTHALQDQHYDLEAFNDDDFYDENPDADLALTALIEGDAQFLTNLYLTNQFTREDLLTLFEEFDAFDFPVLDSAPQIIQNELFFPYTDGLLFVQELYDEGGWQQVNQVYANPPTSTEQVLHPERYLSGEQPETVTLQPAPDVLAALDDGWRLVEEETFGEFYLRQYLEQQVHSNRAANAADGWGGDQYAVYYHERNGTLAMQLNITWDSPDEAAEFAAVYSDYATGRAGRGPSESNGNVTCWTSEDYLCLHHNGSQTLIVLGPDTRTVRSILDLYGVSG